MEELWDILVFEGGVVTPSRLGEAQTWLSDNDAKLRSTAPEGTTYMGGLLTDLQ